MNLLHATVIGVLLMLARIAYAAPLQPPAAPTSLSALSSSAGSIQLSWTNHSSANGIAIEKRAPGGSFSEFVRLDGSATRYDDTGLAAGVQLWYRLRAYSRRGNQYAYSGYTNEASAIPGQIPTRTPTPTPVPAVPTRTLTPGVVPTTTPTRLPTATATPAAGAPTPTPIVLGPGGDLQAALDSVKCGGSIRLQAGATYTTTYGFVLPYKSCTSTDADYITITTSGSLPPAGIRLDPAAYAGSLARLVAPSFYPVISTRNFAHHWKFIGIDFSSNGAQLIPILITLGSSTVTGEEATYSQRELMKGFVFDRCFIHPPEISATSLSNPSETRSVARGIQANANDVWVINSYVAGFTGRSASGETLVSEAVLIDVGPGPLHVLNNYLEAWYANIFTGGSDAAPIPDHIATVSNAATIGTATFSTVKDLLIGDLVAFKAAGAWEVGRVTAISGNVVSYTPQTAASQSFGVPPDMPGQAQWKGDVLHDLEIRGNTLAKRPEWASMGQPKGWIEMKAGRRVAIEGNLMTSGPPTTILITTRNQNGSSPWIEIADLVFRNNKLVNFADQGFNFQLKDNEKVTELGGGVVIENNLLTEGIPSSKAFQALGGRDVAFRHNTILSEQSLAIGAYVPTQSLTVSNNILHHGVYGMGCDSSAPACFPGLVMQGNVIVDNKSVGGISSKYPAGNFFPASDAAVGWVDPASGNYRLAVNSPYKGKASDGRDPGIDQDALEAAIGGITPPPTPTAAPATPTRTPTPIPATPTRTPTPTAVMPTRTPMPTPTPTPMPPTTTCQGTDFYGRCVATLKLFEQRAPSESVIDTLTGHSLFHGAGLAIDPSDPLSPIYVVDTGHSRVGGWKQFPGASLADADVWLGGGPTCNGDDNLGHFKPPTAATLCLMAYPEASNTAEQWQKVNPDVDPQGNVFVPDKHNNRILEYYRPLSADKTGGKGDGVADKVWGQPDFTHNQPNRGGGPTAASIFTSGPFATNISVSVNGSDVWMADTGNHRVMRFPAGAATADVCLGQASCGTALATDCSPPGPTAYSLSKLCNPTIAKIDPSTGNLWVVDEQKPPTGAIAAVEARVVIFSPPFSTGMAAGRQWKPVLDQPLQPGSITWAFAPTGMSFNKGSSYPTGKVWITEHGGQGGSRVVLYDDQANFVKSIGSHDKYERGGDTAYNRYPGCGTIYDGFRLGMPSGSVGFDAFGNVAIADESFFQVSRYALPYTVTAQNCLPDPNGGMLQPNPPSGTGARQPVGVLARAGQLIATDLARILVWNDYMSKPSSSSADFAITQPDLETRTAAALQLGDRREYVVDDANRLWGIDAHSQLFVFSLPLTAGQKELKQSMVPQWQGTTTEQRVWSQGLAFDPINKALWIPDQGRLLRISDYTNFSSGPLHIDAVQGQFNTAANSCNRGGTRDATTLCGAMRLKFDRRGNLWVIENEYECHENNRILMYSAADLAAIPKTGAVVFPNMAAKRVITRQQLGIDYTWYGGCAVGPTDFDKPFSPIAVAFDSQNHMVVSNDGWYLMNTPELKQDRPWKQFYYYADPLTNAKPMASIKLPVGAGGELWFDEQDRLIAQDHTWPKIWVIDLKEPGWLEPIP